MTRASELWGYPLRPQCLRKDEQQGQEKTCTQGKEPTFLPEGKQLLWREQLLDYLTTSMDELHHEAV